MAQETGWSDRWPHVVAAVVVSVWVSGCGEAAVSSSTAPSSTTSPVVVLTTSSTTLTTSTTAGSSFEEASLPLVAEEVVASDDGIFLVLHGDGAPIVQLWDEPTAVAFMVGEGLVVAQRSTDTGGVYPRWVEGPILVFDPAGVRPLPMSAGQLRLFDAGVVDGRAVALATSTVEGGSDDRDVRLLLVDLVTGVSTDLGSVGGWESGVSQARLAGEMVALVSGGEGRQWFRVRSMDGTEVWALPPGPEASLAIVVKDGEVTLLESGFVGSDSTLTLTRYDIEDGSNLDARTVTLRYGDGVRIDGGFCFTAEWLGEALVCDQTYGGPLLIDKSGAVGYFGGFDRGVLTVPRAGPLLSCDSERAIGGDFDGDGMTDLAIFEPGPLELVVCTAQSTYAVPGSGQGEVLIAADLNGDRIDEILTGGTTLWGAGADVLAIVDGVLDYVHTPDGKHLTLWEGLPPHGFLAYGCGDFTDKGKREVAIIDGTLLSATEASWERSIYRIEGHDAIQVGTDSGTFDPSGSTDPRSSPEITNLLGDRCWTTDS